MFAGSPPGWYCPAIMKLRLFILCGLLLAAIPAKAAHASEDCLVAYETAAQEYWMIVNDMLTFKVMFDEYDRLCSEHYPEQVEALQPEADLLRKQIQADIESAKDVAAFIFDETLPSAVPPSCSSDEKSRAEVKRNFLAAMATKTKTTGARLQKSAMTLHDPKDSLKLCRELKPLAKKIRKKLGPELEHPLLEMSALHSRFVTKDSTRRKDALAQYRSALKELHD